MFKLVRSTVCEVTKELAQEICRLRAVPGERKLNPKRLAAHEKDFLEGFMLSFSWVTASLNGHIYRINGMHTSHLFASGRVAPQGKVHLELYHCDTMEDLIALWSRFDSDTSTRTKLDKQHSYFSSDEELKHLPSKISRCAHNACSLIEYGSSRTATDWEKNLLLKVPKYRSFVKWICGFYFQKRWSNRAGIFVAAFYTFEENPELAKTFWLEVLEGTNPDPKSGSRCFQREMLVNGERKSGGRKIYLWEETAELGILSWKNWLYGKKMDRIKLSGKGLSHFMKIGLAVKEQ